jgi:hypothetical protein
MAGAMRELFESSEGVVAKLLRERKELNQEMMAELLKGANRDEQQQAAAAIAGIGVNKLNEYLAEKKYQRAKEKGNAEEVDPERHTAEKQEEVISKLNQLRNGFGGIDYKQLKQDTLKYYPEGSAKKSILDEIEMDIDLLSLSDAKKEILEGGLLTEPFANKIQRRYKVLQSKDYVKSRTNFLLSQQTTEEEADAETTDGMIGNVVNDATDNQLDNSKVEILKNNEVETNKSTTSVKKKKKKEEEEGLFDSLKGFFS